MEPIEAITDDLKARARILQRAASAGDDAALRRMRALPELRGLDDGALSGRLKRRHALTVVARELGFGDWPHLTRVLTADGQVDDFGTALVPGRCGGHWNIWSASYDEARAIRAEHGGFLLAYRHQFLIVDHHYVETLGLPQDDPDWARIARDWVRPADPAARTRLYGKLLRA